MLYFGQFQPNPKPLLETSHPKFARFLMNNFDKGLHFGVIHRHSQYESYPALKESGFRHAINGWNCLHGDSQGRIDIRAMDTNKNGLVDSEEDAADAFKKAYRQYAGESTVRPYIERGDLFQAVFSKPRQESEYPLLPEEIGGGGASPASGMQTLQTLSGGEPPDKSTEATKKGP